MVKVFFNDTENSVEFEKVILAEELRNISDLKPKIYFDGNEYRFLELQYNPEFGSFVIHINREG
jgi:hypothetical protein